MAEKPGTYTLVGATSFPWKTLANDTASDGDAPAGDDHNATSHLAVLASDTSELDLDSGLRRS